MIRRVNHLSFSLNVSCRQLIFLDIYESLALLESYRNFLKTDFLILTPLLHLPSIRNVEPSLMDQGSASRRHPWSS